MLIVDLAMIRVNTARHLGKLDLPNNIYIRLRPQGQIIFKNVDVIADRKNRPVIGQHHRRVLSRESACRFTNAELLGIYCEA